MVCTTDITLIDNLEVRKSEDYLGHNITDHYVVNFEANLATRVNLTTKTILNHREANFDNYRVKLDEVDWGTMIEESMTVSELYDAIIISISQAYIKCMPSILIRPGQDTKDDRCLKDLGNRFRA